jgi:hypothetical protein
MHASTRDGSHINGGPLFLANLLFLSDKLNANYEANIVDVLRCFQTVWPVLCTVAPQLRGRTCHLTAQDVDDLFLSLSREFARQVVATEM